MLSSNKTNKPKTLYTVDEIALIRGITKELASEILKDVLLMVFNENGQKETLKKDVDKKTHTYNMSFSLTFGGRFKNIDDINFLLLTYPTYKS